MVFKAMSPACGRVVACAFSMRSDIRSTSVGLLSLSPERSVSVTIATRRLSCFWVLFHSIPLCQSQGQVGCLRGTDAGEAVAYLQRPCSNFRRGFNNSRNIEILICIRSRWRALQSQALHTNASGVKQRAGLGVPWPCQGWDWCFERASWKCKRDHPKANRFFHGRFRM